MTATFFENPLQFRQWLEAHHAAGAELWAGYHKAGSGKPSLTWPQSVDQALCFGWIDGVRKGIDESSYRIRFTPRRPRSIWSAVNIGRVEELTRLGLMRPAGLAAYAVRKENRSGVYAYEQRTAELPEPYAGMLKASDAAWAFFEAQPPSYRKTAGWWVVSAKTEATRLKRLQKFIGESAESRRL